MVLRAERQMKGFLWAWLGSLVLVAHVPTYAGEPQHVARVTLPTDVVPRHYDLDIELDHALDRFSGTTQIAIDVKRPTSDIVLNAVMEPSTFDLRQRLKCRRTCCSSDPVTSSASRAR